MVAPAYPSPPPSWAVFVTVANSCRVNKAVVMCYCWREGQVHWFFRVEEEEEEEQEERWEGA